MAFRFHDLLVNLADEVGGEQAETTKCCPSSPVQHPKCEPKSYHRPDDDKKKEERRLADFGQLQSQLRQALDAAGA
jgi:hypothetical protein